MQPVEINAGSWYLRGLRADDRLSDVPALADLGCPVPAAYISDTDRGWADETRCVWAVCEPTTGELLAVIGVGTSGIGDAARLSGLARREGQAALDAAVAPVRRFAEGALGWTVPSTSPPENGWP